MSWSHFAWTWSWTERICDPAKAAHAKAGSPATWARTKKPVHTLAWPGFVTKSRLCAFLGNASHETLTPLFNHIQLVTLELRTRRSNPFCCSGEKSHLRVKRKASLRIGHIATIPCLLIVQRQSEREKIDNLCKDCWKRETRKRERLTIYLRIAEKEKKKKIDNLHKDCGKMLPWSGFRDLSLFDAACRRSQRGQTLMMTMMMAMMMMAMMMMTIVMTITSTMNYGDEEL